MSGSDPFSSRNTWFVARVRNIASKPSETQTKISSPKKKKSFNENANYACIPNPKNNAVYVSESTFSGKLLNSQCTTKDSLNSKFLFPENSEKYVFDNVFHEGFEQKDFYNETTRPLLNYALSGVNSVVLTYGPHRAGKSFTMRGDENSEIGLIPRFAKDLISYVENSHYGVYISVIQIYKDWVFDLLRADQDIGYSLTEDYDNSGISKVKIQDLKDFIRALGEAFMKRELNSVATNVHLKKFHLVIRISLVDERSSTRGSFSKVDFIELPESSFLINQKHFQPGELEWLNSSFDSLFDILVKYLSKETKKINTQKNALNNYLEMNLKSKGKFLFICCLSPSLKDVKKSRDALQYASNLRSLIIQKGEKSLVKGGQLIPRGRSKSPIGQTAKSSDLTPQSPSVSVDKRLKSIKSKLSNASITMENGDDFEDWIQEREYEIMKIENEVNLLPANSEKLSLKLKELAQLKNEIKLMKDKKRRTNKTSHSVSYDNYHKLNQSDMPTRKNLSGILVEEDESYTSSNRTPTRKKSKPNNKANKSSLAAMENVSKSRSRSPVASPINRSQNSSFEAPKRKGAKSKESSTGKTPSSKPTPKFLTKTKSVLTGQIGGETKSPKSISPKSRDRSPSNGLMLSQSFTGILKETSRGNTRRGDKLNASYSISQTGRTDRNLKSLATDRSLDTLRRSKIVSDARLKSEVISPKKSGNVSGNISMRSRSRVDLTNLAKLLEKSQQLKSLKDKTFTFFDEEEEYFVRKKLNDCPLDKLIIKYKTMFYKSREIKDLLNEVSDNDYKLRAAAQYLKEDKEDLQREKDDMKEEKDNLIEENQRLREELDMLTLNFKTQEKEIGVTLREYEQKLLNTEQQNDYLSHKLGELNQQNEMLSSRFDGRSPNKGLNSTQRLNNRSQRHATEPGDSMESRIQELERALSYKDKIINDLEDKTLKDSYNINELKADLELMRKKLMLSQEEMKDMHKDHLEVRAKQESNVDIISSLRDQIQELQLELKLKAEQMDKDKHKIRELKDKVKDLDSKYMNTKSESDKASMEAHAKERLEQKLLDTKEELRVLKSGNEKLHSEIISLNKANKALEDEVSRRDATIDDLKKRMSKLADAERRVDKYVDKNERLKNIRDEFREENQRLRLEVKKADTRVRDVESVLIEVRGENQILIREKEELQRKISNLREEGDETKRELVKMEDKVIELSAQTKESQKSRHNYKNQLERLQHEHVQLKEHYKEKEISLKNEMDREMDRLSRENEKYLNSQNRLKVINDIQTIIKSHKKNKENQY